MRLPVGLARYRSDLLVAPKGELHARLAPGGMLLADFSRIIADLAS